MRETLRLGAESRNMTHRPLPNCNVTRRYYLLRIVVAWRNMSRMDSEHNLVGATVMREINRQYGGISAFVTVSGVSKKTVERLVAGVPTVSRGSKELIEGKLGLPRDTFTYIEKGDMDALVEIGVEADLVRWIRKEMGKSDESDSATG